MKRSEMIDSLYDIILSEIPLADALYKEDVDRILTAIEKAGMLPPEFPDEPYPGPNFMPPRNIWEEDDNEDN